MFQKDEGGRINEPTGVLGSGNEVIWFKALSNFVDDNFLPLGKIFLFMISLELK